MRPGTLPSNKKELLVEGTTLKEAAMLRILSQKVPEAGPMHVMALLCILREKNSYFSLEDIEKNTLIRNGELKKIMDVLSKNSIVEKEGCLYRRPESEKIAEII